MSGRKTGAEYTRRVEAYLAEHQGLPVSTGGKINMTHLASVLKIPKQSLYKNPGIRLLIDEAKKRQEIAPKAPPTPEASAENPRVGRPTESIDRLRLSERRVRRLEQQNAALVAENAELRRQLKGLRIQLGREDMMIETGRRLPVPEVVLK
jgi:hypothetical protein